MSSSCCGDPTTTALPVQNVVQTFVADGKITSRAALVEVDAADVALTLPYQPPRGTSILVSSRTTGATVAPGCEAPDCCDDDDPDCDTFCDDSETIAVPECGQVRFVYHPGDPCADPATTGVWTSSAVEES